jgi:hypothetical protein
MVFHMANLHPSFRPCPFLHTARDATPDALFFPVSGNPTSLALLTSLLPCVFCLRSCSQVPSGASFPSWCDCSLELNLYTALHRMQQCFLRLYYSRVSGKAPRPPPKPPSEVAELSLGAIWLVLGSVLAVGMFGCLAYFLFCVRHTTASAFMAIGNTDKPGVPLSTGVPVARISADGRASVVQGSLVGQSGVVKATRPRSKNGMFDEQRQSLLGGPSGF